VISGTNLLRISISSTFIFKGALSTGVMVLSMLLMALTGLATASSGISLYSGKIVFGIIIGSLLLKKSITSGKKPDKLTLFIGLAILTLLSFIPVLGTLVYILVCLLGAGAIVLGVRDAHTEEPNSVKTSRPLVSPPQQEL